MHNWIRIFELRSNVDASISSFISEDRRAMSKKVRPTRAKTRILGVLAAFCLVMFSSCTNAVTHNSYDLTPYERIQSATNFSGKTVTFDLLGGRYSVIDSVLSGHDQNGMEVFMPVKEIKTYSVTELNGVLTAIAIVIPVIVLVAILFLGAFYGSISTI